VPTILTFTVPSILLVALFATITPCPTVHCKDEDIFNVLLSPTVPIDNEDVDCDDF
jgi:hypothetical protein